MKTDPLDWISVATRQPVPAKLASREGKRVDSRTTAARQHVELPGEPPPMAAELVVPAAVGGDLG